MERRRVVVTGIGALTPIGNTSQDFWNGLVEGKRGCCNSMNQSLSLNSFGIFLNALKHGKVTSERFVDARNLASRIAPLRPCRRENEFLSLE